MNKKAFPGFALLCCLVYFCGYFNRLDYAAALTAIIQDTGITRSAASVAVTGIFITYGAGQLLSGLLGDRFSPRFIITAGLIGTAACNVAMTLPVGVAVMTAVWCVNGVFQAMLWPPMVRAMAERFSPDEYRRACAWVSAAASVATVLIYLLVPACLALGSWRWAFVFSAVFAVAVAAVWATQYAKFSVRSPAPEEEAAAAPEPASDGAHPSLLRLLLASGLPLALSAIALQGILRDGVLTWVPEYVKSEFHLDAGASILSTVILPLFSIFSVFAATALLRAVRSETLAGGLCFGVGAAAATVLALCRPGSIAVTLVLMALIVGAMHGVNMILTCHMPAHFAAVGAVSGISGLVNMFTYLGSAVSAYGIAACSERFGWGFTLTAWMVVAWAGTAACLFVTPQWHRFCRKHA